MSNKEIIKSFIRAVESRNAEKVATFFDDNIVFENMPEGSVIRGKEKAVEQFKNFFELTSKIEWKIEHELFSGELAVVERKAHICFKGNDITLPMVSIIKTENAKIVLFRDYFDSNTFAKQLSED